MIKVNKKYSLIDSFEQKQVTVGILLQPFYFPPKDSSNRPGRLGSGKFNYQFFWHVLDLFHWLIEYIYVQIYGYGRTHLKVMDVRN